MKREYVAQVVNYMAENIKALIAMKTAGRRSMYPYVMSGVLKLKMDFLACYLVRILNWMIDKRFENLSNEISSQEMKTIYEDVVRERFEQKTSELEYSFNDFWNVLLQQNGIKPEAEDLYKETKYQTYVLWRAMHGLFFSLVADNAKNYFIEPDRFDENLPEVTCGSLLFERILKMISGKGYSYTEYANWNLDKPVESPRQRNSLEREQKLNEMAFSSLSGFNIIYPSILLHVIESDLAQSLGNLITSYLSILEVLSGEKDFYGQEWDEVMLTKEELEDNKRTISQLNQTIEYLSKENYLMTASRLEEEKVYSKNPTEAEREVIGEKLKDTPITIPNQRQKMDHPDCRWIITSLSFIESTIRNWKEACFANQIGFWSPSEIRDGLYYIESGELVKDPEKTYPRIRKGSAGPYYRLG